MRRLCFPRASLLLPLIAAVLTAAPLAAQVDARLFRYPDVSASRIAFVYGSDIWVVSKEGGVARRLTTPAGEELFPRFSPDGGRIAYTANYDGNDDVYVIGVGGGVPARLTHHPAGDRLVDWYPSADAVLLASSMTSEKDRFNKLYRLPTTGGLPEQLPLPWAEYGALSEDGRTLAYLQNWRDFRTWKRYRGGLTTDIWLFDLETGEAAKVPTENSNDSQPMWHGSTLYFLSDRAPDRRMNIWAYERGSGEIRQVTDHTDFDIHFPSVGPDEIVYEQGGQLWLLDLDTEEARPVEVSVVTDFATLRPRIEEVGEAIMSAHVSPSGERALFEARGDVYTVPAEHGVVRAVTESSGSAERYPAWSPDGRRVAYWSDRTGEYQLTVEAADGTGEARTVTDLGPGYRYRPYWSPDSRKVAFIDQAMRIQVTDMESGETRQVGQGHYFFHGALAGFTPSWSADSRWLAYGGDLPSRAGAIFVYDTQRDETHQVTSGFYNAFSPAFDPDGNYLYFLTNREYVPSYGDVDATWIYANSSVVAAVPLRTDVDSPLAPRNDDEAAGESGEESGGDGEDPGSSTPAIEIDFDAIESRAVVLPPAPGNYGELQAVPGKVLYHRHPRTGSPRGDAAPQPVVYYDLEAREEKTVLDDATTFLVTADGKKMLAMHQGRYAIVGVAPGQKLDKPLDPSGMLATIDPRAEWRQLFTDAWRLERDYFYDPDMHGVDWPAMRDRYGALLEHAVTRADVNFVIGELIAELNASHTYRGGGDVEQEERRSVGLLGVDWAVENGAYRIDRIVRPAEWELEVRSPLDRPGLAVEEGDYVLAVNGRRLDPSRDPWAALQGLAGATVELTVADDADGQGTRIVLVETLSPGADARLRNLAWIAANRRTVAEATDGRVGYIYVPDTGVGGQTELVRQFTGQFAMDGLIIDERFNSGGQIPDRFIELLNRPVTNFWAVRDGLDWQWPPVAHTGPKVMLINEWSGSGGDMFPWLFREAGLGPLVGKRTWGGLIGISGVPPLVDGGVVTVPTFGIYSTEGEWIVENEGVEPDIAVEMDPSLLADGRDPQLEAAIAEVLRLLELEPPVRADRPEYPVRVPQR